MSEMKNQNVSLNHSELEVIPDYSNLAVSCHFDLADRFALKKFLKDKHN
jgi:hypothetical protein